MIFYQNQYGEFINLDHVLKIWIGPAGETTRSSIFIMYHNKSGYDDTHHEDIATFENDKEAQDYLEKLLLTYGQVSTIYHDDLIEEIEQKGKI